MSESIAITGALAATLAAEESYRIGSEASYRMTGEVSALPALSARVVSNLHTQAIGYVWGWQDAGGARRHTNDDHRFPAFYGLHCAAYAREEIGSRMCIRNAFEEYLRAGTINGVPA